MSYLGTQPNDVKKNTGLYTPSEILQLEKDGHWGGSLELIEEQTASSDSAIIFSAIQENKYDVHLLQLHNSSVSVNAEYPKIRFYENGVEETASVYQWAYDYRESTGSGGESRSTAIDNLRIAYSTSNPATYVANSYSYLYNLGNSNKYSFQTVQITQMGTGAYFREVFGGGVLPQASLVNGIKIYVSSGTFSANIKLFGVKQ